MGEPRIRSVWGRVILILVLYAIVVTLFSVIYVASTGILDRVGSPADQAGLQAELDRLTRSTPFMTGMLLGQAVLGIVVVLAAARGVDDRRLAELGIAWKRRPGTGTLRWGLLLGTVLAAVAVLFITAAGRRHLRPEFFAEGGWVWAAATAGTLLLSAFMEEWFFRGYLFVNLREEYTAGRTIFLTALAFAFFHGANPGAGFVAWMNIVLVGVVIGQLREISGGLRIPVGFHAGWNLTVGMILGAQLSGLSLPSAIRVSLIDLPPALGGGGFGPEASLVVTVLFGGIAVLLGRRMMPAAGGDPAIR